MNSVNVPQIPHSQGPLGKEWVICKWHAQYGEVSHKPSLKRALPPHDGPAEWAFSSAIASLRGRAGKLQR